MAITMAAMGMGQTAAFAGDANAATAAAQKIFAVEDRYVAGGFGSIRDIRCRGLMCGRRARTNTKQGYHPQVGNVLTRQTLYYQCAPATVMALALRPAHVGNLKSTSVRW
jgi:hypothetical protein